jgi:hypothetical protein
LASVGTSGTYTKVSTDSKGRVTAGTTLVASDIPSLTKTKISDFVEGDYVHISGTETITGAKTFSNNVTISGNLTLSGTNTTINTTNVTVTDPIMTLANANTGTIPYIGIKGERGSTDAFFVWNESLTRWAAYTSPDDLTTPTLSNIQAATFYGALSGNADTATKLTTSRTISLSTDATGSATFDGSANATIAVTLANVATAGTYKSVTINAKGLVTAGTNPTTLAGYGITDAQPLNSNLTSLANSSLYGMVSLTAAGNIATRTVTGTSGQISISNGDGITGDPTISLATTGVTAGTYNNITVDSYGRAIAGTNSSYLTANQTVTISGDVSGSGTTAITATLASVGVAGTYTKVTTDAKGRVTSGTTLVAADIPSLTKAKISDFTESNYVHVTGDETIAGNKTFSNDIVVNGNFTVSGANTTINTTNVTVTDPIMVLANNNTGTMPYIGIKGERGSTDAFFVWNESLTRWGAYTSSDNLTSKTLGDVEATTFYGALSGNATTATTLATARNIAVAGDISGTALFDGSSNISISATLPTVNSAPGTIGSPTEIPVITTNAKGQITNITTATVTNTVPGYFSGYNTATTALGLVGTPTQIPMNTEVRKDTAYFTHAAASSQVTVLVEGWYKITAEGNFQTSASSSKGVMQLYKNGTAITGATSNFSHATNAYQTSTQITFFLQCATNDVIDWKAWRTAGGFTLMANSCRLLVETM